MPFYRWFRYLPVACLLAAAVTPGPITVRADITAEFSLDVRTWSCPSDPDREALLKQAARPEACTPLDLTGDLRAKSWVPGTPSDAVDWEETSINGSSTMIEGMPVNGTGVMVQLPAAPDTGSIAFLYHGPDTDGTAPGKSVNGHGWIRYDTGEARAEATLDLTQMDIVLDVLYLESPYDVVADSSITLHRWSCPGSRDDFDSATCSEGDDASPYLWAGPNVKDNAPGRFPGYESDGPTGIYRDLDPLVYRFAAADAGLAGATISDRVLVIPTDKPQEVEYNLFGPEDPGDTYFGFAVEISTEHPAWEFNIYEFA